MLKPDHHSLARAVIVAAFAAAFWHTHVFVAIDRVRVRLVETATPAVAGQVSVNAAGPSASGLTPPVAVIARISQPEGPPANFLVAVDGQPACTRTLAPGDARRFDCTADADWTVPSPTVTIQGPATPWTLEYLEVATHHGNTDGAHYLVVLPARSERFVRPAAAWTLAVWLAVAAILLLLPWPPLPWWVRLLHAVLATLIVLELTASMVSQWVSDYRIVLSSGTFVRLLAVMLAPRLWGAATVAGRFVSPYVQTRAARRRIAVACGALVLGVAGTVSWQQYLAPRWAEYQTRRRAAEARERLFAELQPVALANCEFERFGEANDGGYLLCGNLLNTARAGYSYGISGYDQWGCDVSRRLDVTVHQYDCFNLQVPACTGGRTVFHGECIADTRATIDGRPFDTLANQFTKNGDGTNQVVVKMDVEGAEWDSLLRAPDHVLQQIDQLAIEMHGVNDPDRFLAVLGRLKRFFHVANIHYNNFACMEGIAPFPAEVYELLFVSKRLATLAAPGRAGAPRELMPRNNPKWKDCQSLSDLPPVRD